jgi:hypothetical protein
LNVFLFTFVQWFLPSEIAPPETVLQANTLPGSCWPMERSTGQVTLKLAYPVFVDAVSIDHASWDMIPEGWHHTAPKKVKVIGYPPCNDDSGASCSSLGFDTSEGIEIAQVTYDIDGPSVQTFDSHYRMAVNNQQQPSLDQADKYDNDGQFEADSEDDDTSSCSKEMASCSTPPRVSVKGISFKINENYGNAAFTCLYRVRIHGEPDDL